MKFSGQVVKGDQYGRQLGYPTANIDTKNYYEQELALEPGVYAGTVVIGEADTPHSAAIVISAPDEKLKLEAHLLAYEGDLYGQTLAVTVLGFVRPYKHYGSESDLITAISEDIIKIRMICGSYHG